MQVTIKYTDHKALTIEEVVANAVQNYGKQTVVEILPESTKAHDLIYFGLQQLVTHEQLSIFYERGSNYQHGLKRLRAEVLYKLQEILDQVIIDNEARVS
jgi:hypothetical protein